MRAGQKLTKAERLGIAELGERVELDGRKRNAEEVLTAAKRWAVSTQTAYKMRAEGLDLTSDRAVVDWYASLGSRGQTNLKAAFRRKILDAMNRLGTSGEAPKGGPAEDLRDFNEQYRPAIGDKDTLAELKRERAYYLFRMQRARMRNDYAGEAEAAKHYRNFSDIINECELRARKLGRDLGESYSADDVARLGRAIAYWLAVGAEAASGEIATGLVAAAATGQLDRARVRGVVEPVLLAERTLAPLTRATLLNVGVRLPTAFVNAIREGLAACLEDGSKEFEALYALPVPLPLRRVDEEALTA